MTDWTFDRTIAPPRTINIKYSTQDGVQRSVSLSNTDTSETQTTFALVQYTNDEGVPETAEVVVRKVETKRTTQASVNGAMVSQRLSYGLGLPAGDAITEIETTYEYDTTTSGPVLVRERAETKITMSELAGSLAVPSYEQYSPGTALVTSTVREVETQTAIDGAGREVTRTRTSTWIAYGLTQEGQQSFAEQMKQTQAVALDPGIGSVYITQSVLSMRPLIFQGTEVQIGVGRSPVPLKASDESLARNEINAGGTGRKLITGSVSFTENVFGGFSATIANYTMPFAPDDFFEWVNE